MPRFSRHTMFLPATLAAALVGAGAAAGTYAALDGDGPATAGVPAATAQPAAQTTSSGLTVNEIYRRASAGVVEITSTGGSADTSPFPYGGGGARQSQGSGFVFDDQGHIVTNAHVVDGASSISVRFPNGASYDARVVGVDESTDLAVLELDAPAALLEPLAIADSSSVEVGDGVVAIGSPFGLESSVTSGIVSALHREITAPNDFAIGNAIQTDAAINPGNSGGPLLDLQARVIGVTSQIESSSGGNDGVGFAVPSNTVRAVVSQLISSGKVEHAYLGVSLQTIEDDAASALGIAQGVEVTEVKAGSPAASAALVGASGSQSVNGQEYATGGDVITRVDGKRVTTAAELRGLIEGKSPGDTIAVTYVRDGATKTVRVELGTRPS